MINFFDICTPPRTNFFYRWKMSKNELSNMVGLECIVYTPLLEPITFEKLIHAIE